jgi:hypothetical protein
MGTRVSESETWGSCRKDPEYEGSSASLRLTTLRRVVTSVWMTRLEETRQLGS